LFAKRPQRSRTVPTSPTGPVVDAPSSATSSSVGAAKKDSKDESSDDTDDDTTVTPTTDDNKTTTPSTPSTPAKPKKHKKGPVIKDVNGKEIEDDDEPVEYQNVDEQTARLTARRIHKLLIGGGGGTGGHAGTSQISQFGDPSEAESPMTLQDIHHIGTVGRLLHFHELQSGDLQLYIMGEARARLVNATTTTSSSSSSSSSASSSSGHATTSSSSTPASTTTDALTKVPPVYMINVDYMAEGIWPQPDQLEGQTPAEALQLRNTIKAYMLELRQRVWNEHPFYPLFDGLLFNLPFLDNEID
jgi:hypothetical protein